jgi:hypothetical protein
MDEQGIYCPQCRAYVHFWCLSDDGRPPAGAGVKGIAPGTPIDMFESCKQCGFKGTYKTSDLRTRRIPTEPARAAMLTYGQRRAATLDVQSLLKDEQSAGDKSSGLKSPGST